MNILKTYGDWQLVSCSNTKYGFYANGRGRIYAEVSYHIQHADPAIDTGIFNMKTKKDALKEWKAFKASHSIGGAELRNNLFPIKGA